MNTVRELIEKLQAVDPDALVVLDGTEYAQSWGGDIQPWGTSAVMLLVSGKLVDSDGRERD